MSDKWRSYDSSSRCHQSVAGPKLFARPAADMVALLELAPSHAVLDAGTGSGVAALAALEAMPRATVTGVDPSFEMIRTARSRGVGRVAMAALPNVPFADASFDRVMANFVLSHVASYEAALAEMVRVLRPGGSLAFTAWGTVVSEYRALWEELAKVRLGERHMETARQGTIPWEERLSHALHVHDALATAGLQKVEVSRRLYGIRMTLDEFLATRESSHIARYMRHLLGEDEWQRFWLEARAEFERRFAAGVDYTQDVLIGVGVRGER